MMKTKLLTLTAITFSTVIQAQVLEPSAGGGGNTTIINQEEKKEPRPFLGNDAPVFDPSSELMSWDGRSWNVTDNRVMRARFEKYLNAPEAAAEEDRAYREVLDQILDELSPSRAQNGGSPDLQGAVALLPKASEHYIDARLCDSIMHCVYGAYLAQKNVGRLSAINKEMENETKRLHWNVEQSGGTALSNSQTQTQKKSKDGTNTTVSQTVASLGRTSGYAMRLAEIEILKKANSAKMGITETQAKIEFQALILQLLVQRRFEHVIIGSRLYRRVFSDGDTTVVIKEGSDVNKMFAQGLGTNPTLSTLESLANEAIRDVDEGVQAFEFLIEKEEMESASKRLSEAFFIGEYLPRIRTLERDKKRSVLSFVRDAYQLKSALEVRDYTLARELVERMRSEAKDFDYSKARASIEFHTSVSDAHIAKAKLAAQRADMEAYSKEMQVAIEMWPQNPNLKEISNTVNNITDIKIQALNDLDRLLSQKNYRQINNDKGRFIAAVVDDPARMEQLETVLGDVLKIDMVLMQATKLGETGDRWGAWEAVQGSLKDFPQDPELNQKARELNTEVADFVSTLKRAEKYEADRQTGSSLAWFLKARKLYPRSELARKGIDRLINEYLPEGGGDSSFGSSTSAPADASTSTPAETSGGGSDLDFN
jgi:phage-related protein